MPRDESSPDAQYERIKRQLQDSILSEYPNPERKGCPGDAVLQELTARPLDENLEGDPNWQHVTHCSECYREFLGFRADIKRKQRARRAAALWTSAAAAIVIVAGIVFAIRQAPSNVEKRPQIAEKVFRPRVVDLEGRSMTRSEEGKEETKPIILEREPEELTIRLPFGSRAGTYEVQVLKSAGHPLISVTGQATIQNGTTALIAKVDLSTLEAGNYFIGVRRMPWDWTYYPVVIR